MFCVISDLTVILCKKGDNIIELNAFRIYKILVMKLPLVKSQPFYFIEFKMSLEV